MDTERNAEFLEEIKKKLNPDRLYHSLNVADEAKKLAKKYGADEKKAFTAGLLHDIMKNTPKTEMLAFMTAHGVQLTPVELANPKIWHAIAGEVYLRDELHVEDSEILSAVRWHTTGRRHMSLLEKVVFTADFISADRSYDGVEEMRRQAYISLEKAMCTGLKFTLINRIQQGLPVSEESLFAYNTLVTEGKDESRMQPLELLENTVKILDRKNGMNLKALEVAELTSLADYFVLVTGTSSTHVRALSETLEEEMTKLGVEPAHIEGKSSGWILLDYLSVVVHVFTPEERERINMEKLWGDAKTVDLSAWLTEEV